MTRVGRRRRVLNEEVRAAGKIVGQSPPALREQSSDAPRYGEQASIENHPQVTDFVPRRYRTIMMVVFVGMICAAGVELSVRHADQLAAVLPTVGRAEIEDVIAGRFMAWCSAVVLLLTAAYARVVFMLGRHRRLSWSLSHLADSDMGGYRIEHECRGWIARTICPDPWKLDGLEHARESVWMVASGGGVGWRLDYGSIGT